MGTQRENRDEQEGHEGVVTTRQKASLWETRDEEQTSMGRGHVDYISGNGEMGWGVRNGEYLCLVWGL